MSRSLWIILHRQSSSAAHIPSGGTKVHSGNCFIYVLPPSLPPSLRLSLPLLSPHLPPPSPLPLPLSPGVRRRQQRLVMRGRQKDEMVEALVQEGADSDATVEGGQGGAGGGAAVMPLRKDQQLPLMPNTVRGRTTSDVVLICWRSKQIPQLVWLRHPVACPCPRSPSTTLDLNPMV